MLLLTMPSPPCPAAQGVKRTKLGLRDFIKLGEFVQTIDTANSLAVRGWGREAESRVLCHERLHF